MIPDTLQNNQASFRIMRSTLIGLPSPSALRSNIFPGVRIGFDPIIGNYCIIFGNVFIGNQFRCGDNVLIRDNTSIGDEVTIGDWSFIDTDVVVADGVSIGDDVWIPRTTRIGRNVVIGSNVRLLTDLPMTPHANGGRYGGIILEDGCTIGKNAVIGPGVCVSSGACVEAGAVVTGDITLDAHLVKNTMLFMAPCVNERINPVV